MQDNVMQAQVQPFMKLAQANMELLTRFWTSPEVQSQAATSASVLFQQASESAMKLMQSGASTALMQGMLQNYTEFLSEMSQSWMAMMSEGQTALLRQAEEVTSNVTDMAAARGRSGRQAA
jgi:Mg2+ and Co2+ transporter CorA